MVSADSAELEKAPDAGCDDEGCPGYSVWAEQGPEPQPNSFCFLISHLCLLIEEGVNMKTGIYDWGEIVTQPFHLSYEHKTKPNTSLITGMISLKRSGPEARGDVKKKVQTYKQLQVSGSV